MAGRCFEDQEMDDWYNITKESFNSSSRVELLSLYRGSPSELIMSSFPEHDWKPWMFQPTPRGFWSLKENQKKYMEWLRGVLKIEEMDDWYGVTVESFSTNNGRGLLALYGNSPSELIMSTFPEHDWKPWIFKQTHHGFWSSQDNRKKYMEWLGGLLNVNKMEDWYGITVELFTINHGGGLLSLHGNSPGELVMSTFPEHDWKPWMFKVTPKGFWPKKENQQAYLEWLGGVLGVDSVDEWRGVPRTSFEDYNGGRLLHLYKGSIDELLSALYPDYSPAGKEVLNERDDEGKDGVEEEEDNERNS